VRQGTAQRPAGTLDVIAHSAGVRTPTLNERSCEREHGSGYPLSYGNKSWTRSTRVSRSAWSSGDVGLTSNQVWGLTKTDQEWSEKLEAALQATRREEVLVMRPLGLLVLSNSTILGRSPSPERNIRYQGMSLSLRLQPDGRRVASFLERRWAAVNPRLICLVRTHKWHSSWDNGEQKTVWTCARCGRTRVRIAELDVRKTGWSGFL
jgi:hypothetical protein